MNQYDNICYKRNFLKNVILRFDFSSDVEELVSSVPAKLEKVILKKFNIKEERQMMDNRLVIAPNKPTVTERVNWFLWVYYNQTRSRFVEIGKKHLSVSLLDYDTFEEFCSSAFEICDSLYSEIDSFVVKRIGLRYINEIVLDGNPVTDWKGFVNSKLIANIDNFSKYKLSRVFSQCVLSKEDHMVLFQYGMHNPDFPSVIKARSFILDYDAYYEGVIEKDFLKGYIEKFHYSIQELFESSIGKKLKAYMVNGKRRE